MSELFNYINGNWVSSNEMADNINPSDLNDVVGRYARADSAQTRHAIEAAHAAFLEWSHTSADNRAKLLDAVANEIMARKDELGRILAREEGKTLAEAIGEAERAGAIFKFFAGEALRIPGERL